MSTVFRQHWFDMTPEQREAYAERAGTTAHYIRTHLISVPPRKMPRADLMRDLADASDALTFSDVLTHFYSGVACNPF